MLENRKADSHLLGESRADTTIGNQQERRSAEIELSWVAGIIEGEAYIGLAKHKVGYLQYVPRVQIINTDEKMLDEVGRILVKNGLPYFRKRHNVDPRVKRKPCHDLVICGIKRVVKTLEVILPYLRAGKKKNAEIVYEFCKHRLSHNKFRPYTKKEHKLYCDYRKLVESSETIRPTS